MRINVKEKYARDTKCSEWSKRSGAGSLKKKRDGWIKAEIRPIKVQNKNMPQKLFYTILSRRCSDSVFALVYFKLKRQQLLLVWLWFCSWLKLDEMTLRPRQIHHSGPQKTDSSYFWALTCRVQVSCAGVLQWSVISINSLCQKSVWVLWTIKLNDQWKLLWVNCANQLFINQIQSLNDIVTDVEIQTLYQKNTKGVVVTVLNRYYLSCLYNSVNSFLFAEVLLQNKQCWPGGIDMSA